MKDRVQRLIVFVHRFHVVCRIIPLRQPLHLLGAGEVLSDSRAFLQRLVIVERAQGSYDVLPPDSVFAEHPEAVILYLAV